MLCRLFLLQSLCGLMSRAEQPHGSGWCCFRMRNEPGAPGTSSSLATYKFPGVTETMYLFHREGAELHQEKSLLCQCGCYKLFLLLSSIKAAPSALITCPCLEHAQPLQLPPPGDCTELGFHCICCSLLLSKPYLCLGWHS